MKREKWSFNRLMFEALSEYVNRHKEGNVSFPLDKFGLTWTEARSVNHCAVHGCKGKVEVIATQGKEVLALCRDDFNRKKPQLSGWREI